MQRRVWFLAAAAAAVFGLASSAAAMTAASSGAPSLHAAPFAKAWASIPRTPAAREARKTMVFGLEQTVTGFNILDADENAYYAAIVAGFPVVRGLYIVDQKGNYHLDLASRVVITKKYLRIRIRKNANWYWVGHQKPTPVTAADFIYTWKQLLLAGNNPSNTAGYVNIARATGHGKIVTFYWKKGQAFADYRDLFPTVLPGFALRGQQFNDYWHNCVCGNDGQPISDGPFYMSSYTPGQGMVLLKNTHWYGSKAKLNEVAFKIITDTNSEIQAMRGGEVDAINPSPETALSQLVHQSNLHYSAIPSLGQEHWDIEVGPQGNALLKQQWMRTAIAEGLNRQSLIKALYGSIAPGLKPLNNPEYELGPNASGKYAYFKKYNLNPKKAIKLLKAHGCTGGPSSPNGSNNKVWTCGGKQTVFRFDTTVRASRQESGAIFKQELLSIGIKIDDTYHDPAAFFGTLLPNANFDIAEYGWSFGSPDPSNWDAIYQCYNAAKNLGGSNYKRYCNKKVDSLLKQGDANLNPTTRNAQYEKAASILSSQIAVIPLYAPPSIFVYKKALQGASESNNATNEGPTWNIQLWHWH